MAAELEAVPPVFTRIYSRSSFLVLPRRTERSLRRFDIPPISAEPAFHARKFSIHNVTST